MTANVKVASGSRFQRMSNKAIAICVSTFIVYILLVLTDINQECNPGTHERCLGFFLAIGGTPKSSYLLDPCGEQRATCQESGMIGPALRDEMFGSNFSAAPEGSLAVLIENYNFTMFYCFCLIFDVNISNGAGLDGDPEPTTCNFLASRAIFFVVGVILCGILEGTTLAEDSEIKSKRDRFQFFFGRLACILLTIIYFMFASIWYQKTANPAIYCSSDEFQDVADVATTLGVISLLCTVIFVLAFEASTFKFLNEESLLQMQAAKKTSGNTRGSRGSIHPAVVQTTF